ncbi:MAG: DUF3267 domain-containing protein [Anaerolineales bacterium]|nr:DUF3267 domain-containing protein [Anaerolineales bacterium]
MNTSTQTLPDGYVQSAEINLKKDMRLAILLNIGAFITFIPMFYLLSRFIALVRPDITNFSVTITIGKVFSAIGLVVLVLIIHEIIHGLFFWIFSHGKPVFALRPLYAYAGAPTWFFPKRQYAITVLGPLVIIGAMGLLLLLLAPISWILMIAFLVALNTGGAVGDLFVFIRLLKCSPMSFANDTGEVVTFFERP